jgi:excisionase family DNA binding protein
MAEPTRTSESIRAAYRVQDLATMLNISTRSVWRLQSEGRIPGMFRPGRRTVRWNRVAVDAWLAEGCPRPKSR